MRKKVAGLNLSREENMLLNNVYSAFERNLQERGAGGVLGGIDFDFAKKTGIERDDLYKILGKDREKRTNEENNIVDLYINELRDKYIDNERNTYDYRQREQT